MNLFIKIALLEQYEWYPYGIWGTTLSKFNKNVYGTWDPSITPLCRSQRWPD